MYRRFLSKHQLNSQKNKNVRKTNQKKLGEVLFFIFLGVFLLIVGRLSFVAIFKTAHHVNLAQQTRNIYAENNVLKPHRGTIYDANGQPLAEDSSSYSIFIVLDKKQKNGHKPLYVTNKAKTARVISKELPISKKRITKLLYHSHRAHQISLGAPGQNISPNTKQKIEHYHLNGVHFTQQQGRLYPNGIFASHLIGIASPVINKKGVEHLRGQMGLERALNKPLSGRVIHHKGNSRRDGVKSGDNVYTTLDYRLQSLLEDRMSEIYKKAHPQTMSAVLMNAKTGDILAATQRPSFNATNKKGLNKVWRDVLTQDLYEPGSTMKVFTIAASINSHHYHGNELYHSGKYYVDGKLIPDWDKAGWGNITFNKGFALSSNVAMAHLERQMGAKTWLHYIHKFKLTKPINIGLDDPIPGSVAFKYPIEQANTAFGQGIDVNSLMMMRGLSAISNNGAMLQPHLISKIVDPKTGKKVKTYHKHVIGHPISKKTAELVRKHMEDVVYKSYGIGHPYKIHGYPIAAKTGTAQISNGRKGYMSGDNNYLYSVAGIAPANNPKYVLYLTMKKPKTADQNTAEEDLANIFKPVLKTSLDESNHPNRNHFQRMPNLKGKTVQQAKHILKKMHIKVVVEGRHKYIKDQSIPVGDKIIDGNRVILFAKK